MSKFDTIRASGDMMPTAMGSTAIDGKTRKFFKWKFLRLYLAFHSEFGRVQWVYLNSDMAESLQIDIERQNMQIEKEWTKNRLTLNLKNGQNFQYVKTYKKFRFFR